MSAKTVDVLIFIPLLPAIPVIATWFLPWEQWIPRKVPYKIIGPYLLYCAFAIWHFKQPSWATLLVALGGIAVSGIALFEIREVRRLKQARDWPVVEGCILHTGQSRSADGLVVVTITFTYKVHGERFGGSESFTFTGEDDAQRFESGCRERLIKVHYRHEKPQDCVLDREGMS